VAAAQSNSTLLLPLARLPHDVGETNGLDDSSGLPKSFHLP
jgi:hypothetical protein